jgi:hypothetical protein
MAISEVSSSKFSDFSSFFAQKSLVWIALDFHLSPSDKKIPKKKTMIKGPCLKQKFHDLMCLCSPWADP